MSRIRVDLFLALPVILLSALGLLILRSVSPELVSSQLTFILISCVVYLFLSHIDYRLILSFHFPIYVVSLIFLLLPFLTETTTRETHRWLQLGISSLQPSEVIKPFLLMTFSVLAVSQIKWKTLYLIISFFIPALIIFLQPDLGTTLVLMVGWFTPMLFHLKIRNLVILSVLFAVSVPGIYKFALQDYQRQRLITFVNPYADPLNKGYHVIQSTIAVGSGQLFGRGLGQGTQSQLRFLPEHHTDFVFSSISEELGFMGGLLVISLYLGLFWRVYSISQSVSDPVGSLYCLAILVMLAFQIIINIGMNIGIAPVTGITLPLLSYGGSSLLSLGISLGIVNSIAARTRINRSMQIL